MKLMISFGPFSKLGSHLHASGWIVRLCF